MTNTNTGTCQICERACKLPKGTVSLHGYKRPGHGWITGSCWGSHELPYEQSCTKLVAYVEMLNERRVNINTAIARFEDPTLAEITVYPRFAGRESAKSVTYTRGVTEINTWGCKFEPFADALRNKLSDLASELRAITREIDKQDKRVAAWVAPTA